MSSAVLEARAVIRGEDRTKAVFDSIEARLNKLIGRIAQVDRVMERTGHVSAPIDRAAADLRRFESAAGSLKAVERQAELLRKSFVDVASGVDKATAALTRLGRARMGATGRGHGEGRFGILREIGRNVGPMMGLGIAYEGYEGVRTAIHGGFERQHERARMVTAGMTPREIADTQVYSAHLAAQYPAVAQGDIMHLMRNARSVVGSYEEAAKILQPLLDLRVVAQGAHPGQGLEQDFDQLIKGMEIKGVTQDPAKFRSYINAMGKAVNAFGDTLRPTDFYEMFKYGRQSTTGFSQDYMMTVAPTIAQEMGGSSAGVANSAFFSAIVGGHMTKAALQRLTDLGLVDRSKVVTPKGGHIANAAGAIEQSLLAQANPYEWVNKVLLPAMARKGIVDPDKIQEVINSVFSNKMAAQLVGIYATQQSRIEKDRGVISGTMDTPEAARHFMEHDPVLAAEGLENAIKGLASTLADRTLNVASMMTTAAMAIGSYTSRLEQLYDAKDQNKTLPFEGQEKVNGFLNAAIGAVTGWTDGTSFSNFRTARNEKLRKDAKNRAAGAWSLDDDADAADYSYVEDVRNAAILRRMAKSPSGYVYPADRVRMLRDAGILSQSGKDSAADAQRLRQQAEMDRAAGVLVDQLDDFDHIERLRREMAPGTRRTTDYTAPSGLNTFSLSRSYADIPLGADLTPHDSSGVVVPRTPGEGPIFDPEVFKSALDGSITAKLDPDSKASVDVTIRVDPSSDLLRAVETARSVSAAGSLAAGSAGVSTPTQPYHGPAGIGRM